MNVQRCSLVIAVWMMSLTSATAQQTQAVSTLEMAERMIASCLDHAAAHELPPLTVVVVDAGGALVAVKRQDGASPVVSEAALLKARTSVRTLAPTAVLADVAEQDPPTRDTFMTLQLTTIAGGLPILVHKRLVGAIGVSGALPEQDVACAMAALSALQSVAQP